MFLVLAFSHVLVSALISCCFFCSKIIVLVVFLSFIVVFNKFATAKKVTMAYGRIFPPLNHRYRAFSVFVKTNIWQNIINYESKTSI